jgi:eukaryotic-like serine/threonine-protein kinase
MDDRIGRQIDRYRLVRGIGSGGFGTVYLAEHIRDRTQVALKLLPPLAQKGLHSFLNETRMFRLKHPHIVQIIDFGLEEQRPFLVMAYAPHGTLRQRHPGGTRLPLPLVLSYVQQLASALQYAHDEHILHRDVKPENMLLDANDQILLADFGIAATLARSAQMSMQNVFSSLSYTAPEQIRGYPVAASDQYALAAVVYEWLCGVLPFQGKGMDLAVQHRLDPPPPLRHYVPDLSYEVERVILMALAKEPEQRFATVQAFATALQAVALVRPLSGHPRTTSGPQPAVLPPSSYARVSSGPPRNLTTGGGLVSRGSTTDRKPVVANPKPVTTSKSGTQSSTNGQKGLSFILFGLFILTAVILVPLLITHIPGFTLSSPTPTPISTVAPPPPTPTPTLPEDALFQSVTAQRPIYTDPLTRESERNGTHGWDTNDSCNFEDDGYHVRATIEILSACVKKQTKYQDNFAYQVTINFLQSRMGGIILRANNDLTRFYCFAYMRDGRFSFISNTKAPWCDINSSPASTQLAEGKVTPSDQITLMVIVKNGQFHLYINSVLVDTVTDASIPEAGDIGLYVSSVGTGQPGEVIFKDLNIWDIK